MTTSYDADGRVTATYDTTTTKTLSSSNKLTSYTYDTLKKGYITSSTSYSGGDTYTNAVESYNTQALPIATKVTLTGEGTTLVPSAGYVTSYGYGLTGTLTSQQDPASGGLPTETITYGYDQFGHPTTVKGSGGVSWSYVTATGYDEYGDPTNYTFGPSTNQVAATLGYDDQTLRLTDIKTADSTSSGLVDDLSYTFGNSAVSPGSGLLTETTDSQSGGTVTDTQCFTYDYAERVTQAWTATDGCAATPSPGNSSTVGGTVAPYWQSWTYNPSGTRATQTDHDVTGNTANDTTTAYNYPAQGSATDQPHTLTSTTATGPQAAPNTATYAYDADGNTTGISGGALGAQTLTWNALGQLATDKTSAGTSSYAYDYAGNLIVQRDPGTTTFYTGDEQLVLNTSTGAVSGTRYYSIGGTTIAARTSSGTVDYLIPDRQGTDTLAINATTQAVTRRSYLPFGGTRGTAPTTWPGDKGYVGGTQDTTTSLENLGAREYDSVTGRFISLDPLFEDTSPQQTNGYDYAGNNPVTGSDPTGQLLINDSADGGCTGSDCPAGNPDPAPAPAPVDTSYGGLGGGGGGTSSGGSSGNPDSGPCIHDSCVAGNAGIGGPAPTGTGGDFAAGTGFSAAAGLDGLGCMGVAALACLVEQHLGIMPTQLYQKYVNKPLGINTHSDEYLGGFELGIFLTSLIPFGEAGGSAAEETVPVLVYPGKSLPQTAANMARYMSDNGLDETSTWTRATQEVRNANRAANYKLYQGGPSMEEFPFASTTQGGPGAYLTQVSIDEQRAQGRLLSTFYRQNGVGYGDPYAIWIDWGK